MQADRSGQLALLRQAETMAYHVQGCLVFDLVVVIQTVLLLDSLQHSSKLHQPRS